MKNIDKNELLTKIKKRGIASLFATFVGCANLFVPMSVVACKQPSKTENQQPQTPAPTPDAEQPDPEQPAPEQPDPEQPAPEQPDPEQPAPEQPDPEQPDPEQPAPEQPDPEQPDPKVVIDLTDGIAKWDDFLEKAGKEFKTTIDNAKDIKGFSGLVEYEDLKKFLEIQQYKSKNFNTSALKVHFDFVGDPAFEITPSIINGILKRMSHLHIDGIENGELKISSGAVDSSGNVASKEIFDIEKFNNYISKKRLTKTNIGEISKNENSIILLGIEDDNLRAKKITDETKLQKLLDEKFFKSDEALLDKVTFKGNLKDLYKWTEIEAKEHNVMFTKDSFYKQIDEKRPDTIDINFVKDICKRGSKPNLYNVNIENKEDFVADETINFNKTTLQNVSFPSDINLSLIPFEYVKVIGTLKLRGVLPHKMKYLNADKVIIDGGVVPLASTGANGQTIPEGTDITGTKIKDLYIKFISNIDKLKVDTNTPKGEVLKFKGLKTDYDVLKKLLNIRTDNLDLDIVTSLLLKNYQNCLG